MVEDQGDIFKKSQEFLELVNQQKDFIQEVLKENEKLRQLLAQARSQSHDDGSLVREEIEVLRKRIESLEKEKREFELRQQQVEEENKDFAQRYIEIEEQNNNLANLYVASYQLHSTLDFQEVLNIVVEIVINLIGAEVFSLMLLDENPTNWWSSATRVTSRTSSSPT